MISSSISPLDEQIASSGPSVELYQVLDPFQKVKYSLPLIQMQPCRLPWLRMDLNSPKLYMQAPP